MNLADRMNNIPPYVFAVVAERIREKKAQGIDILNLGIGSPDMGPPNWITEVMIDATLKMENHRYPGYAGSPLLRQAWASYYQTRFNVELHPDKEVLPLIGSKEGIPHMALALVGQGDIVLVPDPGYPVYNVSTILAGGTPYTMPLLEENNFLPDLDAIPADVLERTVAMWLNYPNNPTGAIAPIEFYEKVVYYAKKYDFSVLSDNPYADITFDGYRAPSFLEAPGAMDVAIEINSLSKTYNMAGWRVGTAVGNADLIHALLRVKSNVDTGIFYPLQAGAAAALTGDQSWVGERNKIYKKRRDIAVSALRDAGFTVNTPVASLYVWPRVPEGYNANDLAWHLFDNANVWITPGEAFGAAGKDFMRLALCTDAETLASGLERVKAVM